MRTRIYQSAGPVAVAALLLWTPAVQATPADVIGSCVEKAERTSSEADRLQGEAFRLMEDGEAKEAADRLLEAAKERAPCDHALFEDLRLAARLYHLAGKTERARETMLRAAQQAVWTGDPGRAAHAYVDAALIAAELGLAAEARDAAGRAGLLAGSPLLSAAQRLAIVSRIQGGDVMRAAASG